VTVKRTIAADSQHLTLTLTLTDDHDFQSQANWGHDPTHIQIQGSSTGSKDSV